MMHCAVGVTQLVLNRNEWLFCCPSVGGRRGWIYSSVNRLTGRLVWKNEGYIHLVIVLHYRHCSKITDRKIVHCKAFFFHWQAWTSSSIKHFFVIKLFKNPFIHLMSHKILQIHILPQLLYNIEPGWCFSTRVTLRCLHIKNKVSIIGLVVSCVLSVWAL